MENYEIKLKDTTLSNLLFIYCALLPFEEALASSFGSILKIVGIIIVGYIILRYHAKMVYLDKKMIPIVLLSIYSALSFFWVSSNVYWSYFFRVYIVQVIFLLAVCAVPSGRIDMRRFRYGLIAASILASVFIIFMPKTSVLTEEGRRTLILLGHTFDPNIVASIMMLGFFSLLYEYYNRDTNRKPILFFGSFVLIVLGILFTGSRGALLSTVAAFIIEIFVNYYAEEKRSVPEGYL